MQHVRRRGPGVRLDLLRARRDVPRCAERLVRERLRRAAPVVRRGPLLPPHDERREHPGRQLLRQHHARRRDVRDGAYPRGKERLSGGDSALRGGVPRLQSPRPQRVARPLRARPVRGHRLEVSKVCRCLGLRGAAIRGGRTCGHTRRGMAERVERVPAVDQERAPRRYRVYDRRLRRRPRLPVDGDAVVLRGDAGQLCELVRGVRLLRLGRWAAPDERRMGVRGGQRRQRRSLPLGRSDADVDPRRVRLHPGFL